MEKHQFEDIFEAFASSYIFKKNFFSPHKYLKTFQGKFVLGEEKLASSLLCLQ